MGRTTIREQMRVEKHERKTIKHQKRDQLEAAKAELFADLDQVNEMDQKLAEMGREQERRRQQLQDQVAAGNDPETAEAIRAKYLKTKGEDIFDDDDCANKDEIKQRKYKADE